MKRRELLKLAAASCIPFSAGSCVTAHKFPNARPNIIYILADDLGYGQLGCYGQRLIKTPYLDRMAAEGMRFTRHYAGSTVCAPSRGCLMTGLHTGHATVKNNSGTPLSAHDKTVLQLLKGNGYRTGVIGKWGLGDSGTTGAPLNKGAGYFYGYLDQVHAWNYYPEWLWENDRKVPLQNQVTKANTVIPEAAGEYAHRRIDYSHDLLTQKAMDFIDGNFECPFFLYLAYTTPHANSAAGIFGVHGMETPEMGRYEDTDWPDAQKGLAAMITRMDGDIGRLIKRLQQLGIDKNTVIFFSSDNGPHCAGGVDPAFFNDAGGLRGIKRDLYEGGIRVPLIVRWPGVVKAGSVSDHVSAFWDFLPTACDIAGCDGPSRTDGISFLPELRGRSQRAHNYLYWEFDECGGHTAAIQGKWKYIEFPDAHSELYDLAADSGEAEDLSTSNAHVVESFVKLIKQIGSSGKCVGGLQKSDIAL